MASTVHMFTSALAHCLPVFAGVVGSLRAVTGFCDEIDC